MCLRQAMSHDALVVQIYDTNFLEHMKICNLKLYMYARTGLVWNALVV